MAAETPDRPPEHEGADTQDQLSDADIAAAADFFGDADEFNAQPEAESEPVGESTAESVREPAVEPVAEIVIEPTPEPTVESVAPQVENLPAIEDLRAEVKQIIENLPSARRLTGDQQVKVPAIPWGDNWQNFNSFIQNLTADDLVTEEMTRARSSLKAIADQIPDPDADNYPAGDVTHEYVNLKFITQRFLLLTGERARDLGVTLPAAEAEPALSEAEIAEVTAEFKRNLDGLRDEAVALLGGDEALLIDGLATDDDINLRFLNERLNSPSFTSVADRLRQLRENIWARIDDGGFSPNPDLRLTLTNVQTLLRQMFNYWQRLIDEDSAPGLTPPWTYFEDGTDPRLSRWQHAESVVDYEDEAIQDFYDRFEELADRVRPLIGDIHNNAANLAFLTTFDDLTAEYNNFINELSAFGEADLPPELIEEVNDFVEECNERFGDLTTEDAVLSDRQHWEWVEGVVPLPDHWEFDEVEPKDIDLTYEHLTNYDFDRFLKWARNEMETARKEKKNIKKNAEQAANATFIDEDDDLIKQEQAVYDQEHLDPILTQIEAALKNFKDVLKTAGKKEGYLIPLMQREEGTELSPDAFGWAHPRYLKKKLRTRFRHRREDKEHLTRKMARWGRKKLLGAVHTMSLETRGFARRQTLDRLNRTRGKRVVEGLGRAKARIEQSKLGALLELMNNFASDRSHPVNRIRELDMLRRELETAEGKRWFGISNRVLVELGVIAGGVALLIALKADHAVDRYKKPRPIPVWVRPTPGPEPGLDEYNIPIVTPNAEKTIGDARVQDYNNVLRIVIPVEKNDGEIVDNGVAIIPSTYEVNWVHTDLGGFRVVVSLKDKETGKGENWYYSGERQPDGTILFTRTN